MSVCLGKLEADLSFHLPTIRGFSSGVTDEKDEGCADATASDRKEKGKAKSVRTVKIPRRSKKRAAAGAATRRVGGDIEVWTLEYVGGAGRRERRSLRVFSTVYEQHP